MKKGLRNLRNCRRQEIKDNNWKLMKLRRKHNPKHLPDLAFLNEIQERLKSVYIDNRSFEKVISAFDSKDTLFYLDPPYWIDGEKFYQHDFSPEDHEKLADILRVIKGKFVLSYNANSEVRRLYSGFKIRTTSPIHYSMNNKREKGRRKSELIITNF